MIPSFVLVLFISAVFHQRIHRGRDTWQNSIRNLWTILDPRLMVVTLLWDYSRDWSLLHQWNIKSNANKMWWNINTSPVNCWADSCWGKKHQTDYMGLSITFPCNCKFLCFNWRVGFIQITKQFHPNVIAEHLSSKPWALICYFNSRHSSGKAFLEIWNVSAVNQSSPVLFVHIGHVSTS